VTAWTIFAWITAALDQPLRAAVDGTIDSLFPPILTVLGVVMTIWIALLGYRIALGRGDDGALGAMLTGFIFAAAVGSAITASVYHDYVEAVALNLPNAVGNVVAGGAVTGNNFDQMLGRSLTGGARVWREIGNGWNVSTWLLKATVLLFWTGAGITIAASYAVWLVARVVLYLVIAIGPLFLPMFLFPFFNGYFSRFVGVLISTIVLQILISILAGIMITAEIGVLGQLAGIGGGGIDTDNPYPAVALLLGMGLIFLVCWKLLRELPGIALALAGGVDLSMAGRAGAAVQSYAAGVAGGIGSAVSPDKAMTAVRRASNRPPGKFLGSGP
jgi:type IV secretion system protein VirB6